MSECTDWLSKIMDKAYDLIKNNKKVEIQILLADPQRSFAKSRAKSIYDELSIDDDFWAAKAIDRTKSGLRKIAEAIHYFGTKTTLSSNLTNIPGQRIDALEEIEKLIQYIQEEGQKDDFSLELYFFSEVPSGPMFFLQNILIQGRFCYDLSSIKIPYFSIVNNPACSYDFYDIFSLEFERLWNNSKKENYLLPKNQDSSLQKKLKTFEESNNKLKEKIKELEKKNSLLIQRLERFEN